MRKVITLVAIAAISIVFSAATSIAIGPVSPPPDSVQGGVPTTVPVGVKKGAQMGPVSQPPGSGQGGIPAKVPAGVKKGGQIGPVSPPPDSTK